MNAWWIGFLMFLGFCRHGSEEWVDKHPWKTLAFILAASVA